MKINIIIGRIGSGKSTLIADMIKNNINNGNIPVYLIVPEQFTLRSERNLVEKMGVPGLIDVEVLSLNRLVNKILEEAGGLTRIPLNDMGRNMVLRRIMDENKDKLVIWKAMAGKKGFVGELSGLLSELKRSDFDAEILSKASETDGLSTSLKGKLNDLSILLNAYEEYMQNRYTDADDIFNMAVERLSKAKTFHNAYFYIDGFDAMEQRHMRLLSCLAEKAASMTFAVGGYTIPDSRYGDLFWLSDSYYDLIIKMREQSNAGGKIISVGGIGPMHSDDMVIYTEGYYIKTHPVDIAHIEKEFFAQPSKAFKSKNSNIILTAAKSIQYEVENAARQILKTARNGIRYREMAVVCGDLNAYEAIIRRVFDMAGIPCFIDKKRPLTDNPVVLFLLYALDILKSGFGYSHVINWLKLGFSDLDSSEVDELENYAMAHGIKWGRWKKAFEYEDKTIDLTHAEELRKRAVKPLIKLDKELKSSKTIDAAAGFLHEFCIELNLQQKIETMVEKFRENKEWEYAAEYTQVWNAVMEVLDQMVEISGDDKCSISELKNMMETGFLSGETGIIPTTIDRLAVGDLKRSRAEDIKVLFILGLNDGLIPAGDNSSGLIDVDERDILNESGLNIKGDSTYRSSLEKYGFYMAAAKPTHKLYLSYSLADIEGLALRPSIYIKKFKKLFPDLKEETGSETDMVGSPACDFASLVRALRDMGDRGEIDDKWWSLYDWYRDDDGWEKRLNMTVDGLFYSNSAIAIPYDTAGELYGKPLRTGVSRLEKYSMCPFAHMVEYGLKPQKRKEYIIEGPDMGNLFHAAIEMFTQRVRDDGTDWNDIDSDMADNMIDDVIKELIPIFQNGIFNSSGRYKYLIKRLRRISARAVKTLIEHIVAGEFRPWDDEVRFGIGSNFPAIQIDVNGETVYIEGRIDRVDLLRQDDATYINVVDYKSGNSSFSLDDLYYGLKLQLPLYLDAALSCFEGEVKPSGIFYFSIDDPLIDSGSKIVAEVEKKIRAKLKMDGLVLNDINIVRKMDRDLDEGSLVVPVKLKKDKSFDRYSKVISPEGFNDMINYTRHLSAQITEEMLSGNIDLKPAKKDDWTSCQWCDFNEICDFDLRYEGNSHRILNKLGRETILKKMRGMEDA